MISLGLVFVLILAAYVVLRILLRGKSIAIRQFLLIYAAVLVGGLLIWFGLTGRLHWLFAFIGVALPWAGRLITLIATGRRAMGMFSRLQGAAGAGDPTSKPGATSDFNTPWVHVVLDHDTGDIDGMVVHGTYSGKRLSELERNAVFQLIQEASEDSDTVEVLYAYLDRMHTGWREDMEDPPNAEEPGSTSSAQGAMSAREAREVLGLGPQPSRREIVNAHKRLIQKLHPDRGGSTFLAAKINEAKDFLLKRQR